MPGIALINLLLEGGTSTQLGCVHIADKAIGSAMISDEAIGSVELDDAALGSVTVKDGDAC